MRVKTLQKIKTPHGIIDPGEIITIPADALPRLSGKVAVLDQQPTGYETAATTRMEGDVCFIRYRRELYAAYARRTGQAVNIDGKFYTLDIKEL